jgi:opacity protein-like surface antigen
LHLSRPGILAVIISAILFSTQSAAQDFLRTGPHVFNYNYAEIKYLDVDNADGFGLVGSADIKPNLALKVQYATLSAGSVESNILRLGAANYIGSTNYKQADWVFEAGLDFGGGDVDSDTGLFLSGGVRYALNDAMELNGAIEVSTIYDTDLTAKLAALYEVSTGFAALVEAELGDGSSIRLGVRFYWR